MRGALNKILCLALLGALTAAAWAASQDVAYLTQGKGDLKVIRASKAIKYKNGEVLVNNDEVRTGSQSFAALKYLDGGATVKVFSNSIIKLTAKKQGKNLDKNTSLNKGSLFSKVNDKIKGNYQVETPTTVASVKGTSFLTRYTADRTTIVVVLEGTVEVQHKESGRRTTTNAGSTTIVSPGGEIVTQPSTEADLSPEEWSQIEGGQTEQRTMKIQVTDDQGNLKYIEIRY